MQFNAALDPWINVKKGTEIFMVSPRDIFMNNYDDICGDPIEKFCILKFLIVLAHSHKNNQPSDRGEWESLRNNFQNSTIEYIEKNSHYFNMFGDNAFLQYNFHPKEITKALRYREVYSSGNNAVQYQFQNKRTKKIEQIVLDLIVHQNYSCTFERNCPVNRFMMYEKSTNGNLIVYATLDNLIDTIWYNMIYGETFGKPVWESGFDTNAANTDFLNQMFPIVAKTKIKENLNEMWYDVGMTYPEINSEWFHGIGVDQYSGNSVSRPISYKDNFDYIKEFKNFVGQTNNTKQPKCISYEKTKLVSSINLNCLGVCFKSNSGFSYTEDFFHSNINVKNPINLTDKEYRMMYNQIYEITKSVLDNMYFAIKNSNNKSNETKDIGISNLESINLRNKIKSNIDSNLDVLLNYSGKDEDIEDWKQILKSSVVNAMSILLDNDQYIQYYNITNTIEYKTIMKTLKTKV